MINRLWLKTDGIIYQAEQHRSSMHHLQGTEFNFLDLFKKELILVLSSSKYPHQAGDAYRVL